MSQTVGDFLVERLHAWGVRKIFGYPGDGINGVFGALNRANGKIEFIQARHEEMAAFMASAYAKFTGELGVCIATSGPGASHLLTGLYDARLDHMPVLAITGQQARTALGGHYQQEIDLPSMFKDVASAFVEQASAPAQVRHLVDRAVRIALGERRVTAIILPNDLQDMRYEDPPRKHGTVHSGIGFSKPKTVPYESDLRRAADVLNSGKKVAILVGAGALRATDEVIAIADKLEAGAAKALLGKAVLPDELPWVTGSIGMLGTKPSYDMMTECDTLLMIGSGFPYSEFLPKEGQARGVADRHRPGYAVAALSDGGQPGRRRSRNAARVAAAAALTQGRRRVAQGHRKECQGVVEDAARPGDGRRQSGQSAASDLGTVPSPARSRHPYQRFRLMRQLVCARSENTPRHDGVTVRRPGIDGRRRALRYRRKIRSSRPAGHCAGRRRRHANEQHGGTDHGAQILAAMDGPPLDRLRIQQRGPKSGDLGTARDGRRSEIQRVAANSQCAVSQIRGVDRPARHLCRPPRRAWRGMGQALAADRPVVLEVKTDPEVPPLPPHITLEEAKHLTETLAKGDPRERSVITETAKQVLASLVPGK